MDDTMKQTYMVLLSRATSGEIVYSDIEFSEDNFLDFIGVTTEYIDSLEHLDKNTRNFTIGLLEDFKKINDVHTLLYSAVMLLLI